ncbi:MAG: hypothetical protein C0582_03740 [Alphaproteobacteria bacterium]|nr:MAG: hypothetical protein C0582_03740 [Alphaproteobacteria bacterium]
MKYTLIALSLLFLSSCENTINIRGNLLTAEDMKMIKVGETTKEDLLSIAGPPTYTEQYGGKGWYYVGEETRTTSFFNPKVTERKVIYFSFSDKNVIQRIQIHDESEGLEIKPIGDKTPTLGRDPALFKEIFGSIGKYDEGKHRAGYV